ncbi:uncharacterized protein N7529_003571 [Penicillium soppii]|uniref:uncharacterized protein n=1 Tax=Penicillium soppii TaxID=69789 RepID=UPI00254747EC|nr:uncharacterized protein N7529_003571 [Penicillium soppii]KAJ5871218.1 hypothetical protein N7529_003571 [Penicillium soppii]
MVSTIFPQTPDDLVQPEEPVFKYEFANLPDPPIDWVFLNVRFGTIANGTFRTLKLAQTKVLMKHYFWGIRWGDPKPTSKTSRKAHNLKTMLTTLWKLFYHMQEIHRPKSFDDVLNIYRDSGPRLLRYDLTPRPEPISRWFIETPHSQTVLLPAYSRPDNAPLDLTDIVLQQYLYSPDSFNPPASPNQQIQPELPMQQPPTNTQLISSFNFSPPAPPQQQDQSLETIASDLLRGEQATDPTQKRPATGLETSPSKRRRDVSPGAPAYRAPGPGDQPVQALPEPVFPTRNVLEWGWMPGLHPEHVAPPIGEQQLGPIVPAGEPVYEKRIVSEAIEKALMHIVYADLDRDPSIPIRKEPVKYRTAHSYDDLLDMKIGAFSTTASVRLSPITFEWDPNGAVFPLRGRGPVWSGNSCATDCAIVAGMLLDVGCTKIDRANNRISEFTQNECAYIESTNAAWDTFDKSTSTRVRDQFLQFFLNGQHHLKMGEPIPPWAVWSQVTKNFAQFRYHHIERVTPCKCQGAQPFINSHQGSCILPGYRKGDDKGVSTGTLIERCFYAQKSFPCTNCGDAIGVTGERKIGQLPLRLVMTFDNKTRLKNHTQNIKFRYVDYDNNKQVAHYRWLGGIYNNELHARLYWTDSKRGETDGSNIMMYDSELNGGVIVGGVPPFKSDDRVPLEWVNHKSIPLLFYERIMDPSRELLATAHNAVYDMGNILGRNQNVLEAHVPWSSATVQPQEELWGRYLPVDGQQFNDYNPTWAGNSENLFQPFQPQRDSAGNTMIDPAALDPSVIDPALLNPALYSTTTPPTFDISFLNEPITQQEYAETVAAAATENSQPDPEDRFKNHMFGSMLETPDWLSENPVLWPSGTPGQEGALEFPDLPTRQSPRQRPRRSRSAQSDITMPDADEFAPGSRLYRYTTMFKTALMLSKTMDPRLKAAYKAKENFKYETELNEYMYKAATAFYQQKENERRQERLDLEERQRKAHKEYELAKERQVRKQQNYDLARKTRPEAAEERRQRNQREQEAKEYARLKEQETPEERQVRKRRKQDDYKKQQQALEKTKPTTIQIPRTPGLVPSTAKPMSLVTPEPCSGAATPKRLSETSKYVTVHTTGASAFSDAAEIRRQQNIEKREVKKRTDASKMRNQHAQDKEEDRRRSRKKDDDPTWKPDDEEDSDPDY